MQGRFITTILTLPLPLFSTLRRFTSVKHLLLLVYVTLLSLIAYLLKHQSLPRSMSSGTLR